MNLSETAQLAPNQENIFLAHGLAPNKFSYNVPIRHRLPHPIDLQLLQARLDQLCLSGESLTFKLYNCEESVAFVPGPTPFIAIHETDFPPADPAAEALAEDLCRIAFDLFAGPLLRVHLIRYRDQSADILVIGHHLVVDEQSLHLIAAALISGDVTRHHPYDHDRWAKAWWQRVRSEHREVDKPGTSLRTAIPDLSMAWGCPEDTGEHRSRRVTATLHVEEWGALVDEVQSRARVSRHSLVMAAVGFVLSSRTRAENLAIATVVSQRDDDHRDAIGYFGNTVLVPLSITVRDTVVEDFLSRTHRQCAAAYGQSYRPLIDLMEGGRLPDRIPVCVVPRQQRRTLPYVDAAGAAREAEELPIPDFGMNQFPINIYWSHDRDGTFRVDLYHCPSAVSGPIAKDFARQIVSTLRQFGRNLRSGLAALTLVEPQDLPRILARQSGPVLDASDDSLATRIAAATVASPDGTAIRGEDRDYTYRQLWEESGRVAAGLRGRGVAPGAVVAVLMERKAALVTVIVGILRAGATYLPLDLHTPPQRRAFILEDGRASIVLSDQSLAGWADGYDAIHPDMLRAGDVDAETGPIAPEASAYIIYTSGSTGMPKGVPVAHRNVVSLLDATKSVVDASAQDVWTFFHSVAFDFSVWEIFGCLCSGGRLVVVPHDVARSPEDFHALLVREQVTILNQTPSAFSQLLDAVEDSTDTLSVRYLIFGGERLELKSLKTWFERYPSESCTVVNMYGITETTVHCTHRIVRPDDRPELGRSVGRPLPGWSLHVLDDERRVVPAGVDGEIYVGGVGVAGRYLNRLDLTRQRFIDAPFPEAVGRCLYRSGDRGRYRPDGQLEHLGRLDSQVKLRGFRIELDEIRAALLDQPRVTGATVLLDDGDGDRARVCLRGYVLSEGPFDAAAAKRNLQRRLPDYMVPTSLERVERFPLTENGKIDASALLRLDPRHDPRAVTSSGSDEPERGGRPDALASVLCAWEEVLGTTPAETDNFFDLGGNSMLAARLKIVLERESSANLRLRQLLTHPTPRSMADLLQASSAGG